MSKKYGDACSLQIVVVKIFVHAVFDVINAIYKILKGHLAALTRSHLIGDHPNP